MINTIYNCRSDEEYIPIKMCEYKIIVEADSGPKWKDMLLRQLKLFIFSLGNQKNGFGPF